MNNLVGRLDATRVDKPRIGAIRKAARELETARSVLDAQATRIDFHVLPESADRVTLDGAPLPSEQASVAVVADTAIAITGIGQFRIRPAIRDRDRLLKNLQSAEDYLRATLDGGWLRGFRRCRASLG